MKSTRVSYLRVSTLAAMFFGICLTQTVVGPARALADEIPKADYGNELEQAMIEAAFHGDLEKVKSAISNGARVDARYGKDPAIFKHEDGGTPGWGGDWTALMAAIDADRFNVAKFLLTAGASARISDGRGETPLIMLADKQNQRKEYGELVDLVIKQGEDVNAKTKLAVNGPTQETALHRAAVHGHTDIVRRLINAGADPGARTSAGMRPVDYIFTDEPRDKTIRGILVDALEKRRNSKSTTR